MTTPPTALVDLEKVLELQGRLAEEKIATLRTQLQQRALDRSNRRLRHITVGQSQFFGALSNVDQHPLQIVEVEQQHSVLVGDVEGDGEDAFLDLIEIHQTGKEQRPHLCDRRADRMTLVAEQVPQLHGRSVVMPFGNTDLRSARGKDLMGLARGRSRHGKSGEIALHIRNESRDSGCTKPFDDALERHSLAGSCCPGDQAVPIGPGEFELLRIGSAGPASDEDCALAQACVSSARHFADAEGKRKGRG